MIAELQKRLDQAFPPQTDAAIIRGVREGVLLADSVLESELFLKGLLGYDLRGHLRRAGVLFRVNGLCKAGDLPFESKIEKMPRGNWHWLQMKSGPFRAHICRTDSPEAFPEDTQCRQDARLKSQPDLFERNVVPFPKIIDDVSRLYTWLTFGAGVDGVLSHLCWAMPDPKVDAWLAHTNILRRAAVNSGAEPQRPSPPDKKLSLRFKEHIEEALTKKPDSEEDKRK